MAEIPQLYTCAGGGKRLMVDAGPIRCLRASAITPPRVGAALLRMLSIARGRSV